MACQHFAYHEEDFNNIVLPLSIETSRNSRERPIGILQNLRAPRDVIYEYPIFDDSLPFT